MFPGPVGQIVSRVLPKGWYRALKQGRQWLLRGHLVKRVRLRRWCEQEEERLLQVGGGRHTLDWALNADIVAGDIYWNVPSRLPVPDASVDYVFTEHFLEHLTWGEAVAFVEEVHRILKPGGILRQSTPSLASIIALYTGDWDCDPKAVIDRHRERHGSLTSGATRGHYVNDVLRLWGHRFLHDKETLRQLHRDRGFDRIEWKAFGESAYRALKGLERHGDTKWMKNELILVYEARKE